MPINTALLTPGNFLMVTALAYGFIWLANRGLDRVGLGEFSTASAS